MGILGRALALGIGIRRSMGNGSPIVTMTTESCPVSRNALLLRFRFGDETVRGTVSVGVLAVQNACRAN